MKGFAPGDPRAVAAGRKGGQQRKGRQYRTLEYIKGYRAGARNTRRHFDRWLSERTARGGEA